MQSLEKGDWNSISFHPSISGLGGRWELCWWSHARDVGWQRREVQIANFFFIVECTNGICCHLNKMDEFHSTNNSICHPPLQRAALFTFLLAQVGARVMLGLSTFQIVSGFSCVLCFVPCGIHEKPKESDPHSESHGWDGWDGWDGWGSGSLVCRELGLENLAHLEGWF